MDLIGYFCDKMGKVCPFCVKDEFDWLFIYLPLDLHLNPPGTLTHFVLYLSQLCVPNSHSLVSRHETPLPW